MIGSKQVGFRELYIMFVLAILLTTLPCFQTLAFTYPVKLQNKIMVRPGMNSMKPTTALFARVPALQMSEDDNPISEAEDTISEAEETISEAEETISEAEESFSAIRKIITNTLYVVGKVIALTEAVYGAALVLYGRNMPGQAQILTIGRAGGFDKIRRMTKATLVGKAQGAATAIFHSPSLVMGAVTIAKAKERKRLAIKYATELEEAQKDGEISDEERKKLIKFQKRQIKLENRGIRRVKNARNSFLRVASNLNLGQVQNIIGDTTLMLTAIIASFHPSILGTAVFSYYTFLNMGSLFLDTSDKIGFPFSKKVTEMTYLFDTDRELIEKKKKESFLNPIAKFIIAKVPFFTGHKDSDEVAAEELAFVNAVGSTFAYGASAYLMIYHRKLGFRINQSLMVSAVTMRGVTGLLNNKDDDVDKVKDPNDDTKPGRFRGINGGVMTLSLTAISMAAGVLLDNGKMFIPEFWTPLVTLDAAVKKGLKIVDTVV